MFKSFKTFAVGAFCSILCTYTHLDTRSFPNGDKTFTSMSFLLELDDLIMTFNINYKLLLCVIYS